MANTVWRMDYSTYCLPWRWGTDVSICWHMLARSSNWSFSSPKHRTVFLAPLFVFLAQWAYGQGVIKAWREISKTGGKAGVGHQIDDRTRTV